MRRATAPGAIPARALLLALLALPLAPPAAAGAGARQVAFVEQSSVHVLEGALAAEGAQAFRFPVRADNVTRVSFHLRWDPAASAAFSLAVLDPRGHAVAPPLAGARGLLQVEAPDVAAVPPSAAVSGPEALEEALASAVSRAGRGEWRIAVRADEAPAEPVPYALEVVVTRYQAVVLTVVTLQAGAGGVSPAWTAGLGVLALAAVALGMRLACTRPVARSVVPPGDKSASPTPEQGRCASER